MEDKAFELIEKIYGELVSFRGEVNQRFAAVDKKLDEKADKHDIVKLEVEFKNDIHALYDGYKQVYEKLQEHDKRFDDIEQKIDNLTLRVTDHDVDIKTLKSVK